MIEIISILCHRYTHMQIMTLMHLEQIQKQHMAVIDTKRLFIHIKKRCLCCKIAILFIIIEIHFFSIFLTVYTIHKKRKAQIGIIDSFNFRINLHYVYLSLILAPNSAVHLLFFFGHFESTFWNSVYFCCFSRKTFNQFALSLPCHFM